MRYSRQLDAVCGNNRIGRTPPIAKQSNLPRDMVFWIDDTGESFRLDSNGASQFLRKCGLPTARENVDWVLDSVLSTPIMESADLNGVMVSISAECDYDPGNVSLYQMGVTKSMVTKPLSTPPITNGVQKSEAVPYGYGGYGGQYIDGIIPIGDGKGVDFGKPTMEVYNDRIKKIQHNDNVRLGEER